MKNSVPIPIVVVAVVAALAVVGFYAVRTLAPPPSASTSLGAHADLGRVQNISQKDIDQMKAELAKARGERAATTR